MKRLICICLVVCMLCGCTATGKKYSVTYLNLFDTVTVITGMADSRKSFDEAAQAIYETLYQYHRLFDIYNSYDGIANLKSVNEAAGVSPVKVDRAIIELLLDCRAYYAMTDGKVNAAMGSVLSLWHEARTAALQDPAQAALPDESELAEAAQHTDFDCIIIDEEESTVYISDPLVQLDVGAIAKGWSVQRAADAAPEGYLLSVGGNTCATGAKDADGTPWVIGIQDPQGTDEYLHTVSMVKGSAVTSGSYQRFYTVAGKDYHHIIDPDTLYPSELWCSVTILCDDSGLADALSTALFLLPQPQGQQLLEKCGAEAMWVAADGTITYSPGFAEYIRS